MRSRSRLLLAAAGVVVMVAVMGAGARASVLQEALEEHLKDVAHDEGAESLKHDKHKGEKLHEVDSQLTDVHKNQYSKSSDEGKYVKNDHDVKSASEADSYKGYNSKQDKAEDSETTGFKRGHKKGHHKQGFQNSYHKDESSNKSTFFDDFNDEGDQAAYNSRLNSHDNQGGRAYHGAHNTGQESVRDNYRGGAYDRRGDHGNKHNTLQDHQRRYYLDDAQHYNRYRNDHNSRNRDNVRDYREYRAPHREPGWEWQRWDEGRWSRPGWQRDYGGPGYYDERGIRHDGGYGFGPNHGYGYGESRNDPIAQVPQNAPMVAHRKQTITIYEDPRYEPGRRRSGQLRREEGDYLRLEFKPSERRYAAPAAHINRLVYNYRRQ